MLPRAKTVYLTKIIQLCCQLSLRPGFVKFSTGLMLMVTEILIIKKFWRHFQESMEERPEEFALSICWIFKNKEASRRRSFWCFGHKWSQEERLNRRSKLKLRACLNRQALQRSLTAYQGRLSTSKGCKSWERPSKPSKRKNHKHQKSQENRSYSAKLKNKF